MNRRQALQRLGVFPLAVPWFFRRTRETASFLSQHPGDQAFTKTTSDMRAGDLTAAFFSIVARFGGRGRSLRPPPVCGSSLGRHTSEWRRQRDSYIQSEAV